MAVGGPSGAHAVALDHRGAPGAIAAPHCEYLVHHPLLPASRRTGTGHQSVEAGHARGAGASLQ